MFVDDLDLLALQDSYVDEFREGVAAMVLDDDEPGLGHLDHAAVSRQRTRGAPHLQRIAWGDTQVDARPLDGGRDPRKVRWLDRDRLLEHDGVRRLFRARERNRQPRDVSLFTPEAGPEGGIEHSRELGRGRQQGEIAFATCPRLLEMMREVCENRRCNPARGGVEEFSQRENWGG